MPIDRRKLEELDENFNERSAEPMEDGELGLGGGGVVSSPELPPVVPPSAPENPYDVLSRQLRERAQADRSKALGLEDKAKGFDVSPEQLLQKQIMDNVGRTQVRGADLLKSATATLANPQGADTSSMAKLGSEFSKDFGEQLNSRQALADKIRRDAEMRMKGAEGLESQIGNLSITKAKEEQDAKIAADELARREKEGKARGERDANDQKFKEQQRLDTLAHQKTQVALEKMRIDAAAGKVNKVSPSERQSFRASYVNGVGLAPDAAEAKIVRNVLDGAQKTKRAIDEMVSLLGDNKEFKFLPDDVKSRLTTEINANLMNLKDFYGMGAPQEAELQLLSRVSPDPTSFENYLKTLGQGSPKAGWDQLQKIIQREMETKIANRVIPDDQIPEEYIPIINDPRLTTKRSTGSQQPITVNKPARELKTGESKVIGGVKYVRKADGKFYPEGQ